MRKSCVPNRTDTIWVVQIQTPEEITNIVCRWVVLFLFLHIVSFVKKLHYQKLKNCITKIKFSYDQAHFLYILSWIDFS